MCCSLAPAEFSKTVIYAGEALKGGKIVHVLGYQNTAQHFVSEMSDMFANLVKTLPIPGRDPKKDVFPPDLAPGNAMIIPIPARPGTLTPKNLVSTEHSPDILKDMETALRPPVMRSADSLIAATLYGSRASVQIFEHDIYTVVLADDARDIPNVLALVPEAKRPPLNAEVFEAYSDWYPGWPIAVCCFSNREAARAKPLLWWYEPLRMYAQSLFLPGLDSHTGGVPNLNARVVREHTLAVSALGMEGGKTVRYSDLIPNDLEPLLPKTILGDQTFGPLPNGDWRVSLPSLRKGRAQLQPVQPPGAKNV